MRISDWSSDVCSSDLPRDFTIGIDMDYGDGQHCTASGTARREGELLRVTLAGTDGCGFDARYEGDRIVLPGTLPQGCARCFTGRQSLAGMAVGRRRDADPVVHASRAWMGRWAGGGAS